jgi:lysozyme
LKLSTLGINQLRIDESKHLRAYYDVNGYAIGYGWHNYPNGQPVRQYDTITDAQCEEQFPQVLAQFATGVKNALTVSLSDNQFTALVMYAYNRGIGSFRNSKLRQMINANPKDSRIPAQFTIEWGTNQADKTGLIKRRAREAKIWQTPDGGLDAMQVFYFFLFIILAFVLYKVVRAKPNIQIVPRKRTLQLST